MLNILVFVFWDLFSDYCFLGLLGREAPVLAVWLDFLVNQCKYGMAFASPSTF